MFFEGLETTSRQSKYFDCKRNGTIVRTNVKNKQANKAMFVHRLLCVTVTESVVYQTLEK